MFCPKCGTQNPDTGKFCRSCGTDLSVVAGVVSGEISTRSNRKGYVDRKGRLQSNDPSEILSHAVRTTLMGIGFLVVSMTLFFTGVAGGHSWWWALLFPAFASLATGISQIVRYRSLAQNRPHVIQQPTLQPGDSAQELPPVQAEFIKPQGSIYDTGDIVIPTSVTENTTRHLEINKEGETMTLQNKSEK